MPTILYMRTSTRGQTIEHQLTQAQQAGFKIDQVIADAGESGVATKLADRPEGRRLFDLLRHGDTLVVRWVDRLGRNYNDVSDTIQEFMRRGVVVRTVIHGMTFDGSITDPMLQAVRDALLRFMAALSQAQAEATKDAQRAGIEHAKKGDGRKYRGRKPSYSRGDFNRVLEMHGVGTGPNAIAAATGLTVQTVLRITSNPEGAAASLAAWNL
jgi:DNA invertase Pin-like site-specific DNA recombinase